jgi:hypothetical protein
MKGDSVAFYQCKENKMSNNISRDIINAYSFPWKSPHRELTTLEQVLWPIFEGTEKELKTICEIDGIAITIIVELGRLAYPHGIGPTPFRIEDRINIAPDAPKVREIFDAQLKKSSKIREIIYGPEKSQRVFGNKIDENSLYSLWQGNSFELHFFQNEQLIYESIAAHKKEFLKHPSEPKNTCAIL